MAPPLDLFYPGDHTVDQPHSRFHDFPCERVVKCVSCRRQMSKEWFCKGLKTCSRLKRSAIPFSLIEQIDRAITEKKSREKYLIKTEKITPKTK